jgi:hypothetical protein
MTTTSILCESGCSVQLDLLPPLTLSEGLDLSMSIGLIWAIAFGFRQLIRLIRDDIQSRDE